MKRSVLARIMALLLVFSLLPVNASAAIWDNWFNKSPQTSQSADKKAEKEAEKAAEKAKKEAEKAAEKAKKEAEKAAKEAEKAAKKDDKKPGKEEKPAKPGKNEKPGKPGKDEPTEPEVIEPVVSDLTLVEDAMTADNGRLLRASTYTTGSGVATFAARAGVTQDDVKYFPVTIYDYHTDAINAATDAQDDDLTVREGMYFSAGSLPYSKMGTELVEYTLVGNQVVIPDGDYLFYCNSTSYYAIGTANGGSPWGTTTIGGTTANAVDSATLWTFTRQQDGTYTIQNQSGKYLTINGANKANLTTSKHTVSITAADAENATFTVYDYAGGNNGYMNSLGKTTYGQGYFGGYSEGSNFSLYTITRSSNVVSGYEEWNRWDKATGNNAYGDLFYTGLVQGELVNDQIEFNVPEGGIFDNNTEVKDIYEYVGLPFVLLTDEDGSKYGENAKYYSFDSDAYGAYFKGDPQSGTAEKTHDLHWGDKQPMPYDLKVGDGSTNAFLPFNGAGPYSKAQVNYHFGMRADLPFSMTPNGCVKSTDDNSAHIKFTFSGDDDVWVFIDGHLVIDLGGIHNRLDATIDFAANTITYSEANAQDADNATASYNDSSFATTQQLFSANGVEGVIPMPRNVFAMDTEHEMQVFYLERGAGTSNARIEFNLPMHDTVMVTKDATHSWSQAAEDADLKEDSNAVDPGVEPLTTSEQAAVNNIDFGFTLYKKEAGATDFSPVANTNFYLVGRNVEGVVINQTDAKGHFYLKNGQSAKFITDIPYEGVTYYVVEDQVPEGFVSPDFNFAGEATYDYTYSGYNDGKMVSGTATAADASQIPEQIIPMPTEDEGKLIWAENKSYEVTVKGSIEANDSVEFICSNYLDATLPNPTALAYEDIIVIDYGLPVQIKPLANDVFRGNSIEIVHFGNENVELTEWKDEDDVVQGDWTEADTLDFGSAELNREKTTFTYTLNKQLTDVEVIHYIIKVTGEEIQSATGETLTQYDYALGKIYIVPATVMYYEEDFSDMVTFTGSGWTGEGLGQVNTSGNSDYQEDGVVGTPGDSIYGSDVAYLYDSFDSNGTSYHGDTTKGAIRFTYTFTGTGTTVFARTSATTGYVQFKLYNGTDTSGSYRDIDYRDTYYKDENDTDLDDRKELYNIPIYTQENLPYGTYTVVATVAKAGTATSGNDDGAGKDFYLDGIRVMQPLNEDSALTEKARGAYATDGESNIETITLREKLITDSENEDPAWNFAVMTDIDNNIILAEDYTSIGPKEEVYLERGQSVSFSIKHWHPEGYRMHMGMKAPFGTAKVKLGQTEFALKNATDCYYDITTVQYSIETKYEQLKTGDYLLYTDADGNLIYEDDNYDLIYYGTNEKVTDEEVELTPAEDPNKPYYVATYTFTAVDSIVSLTNIKITGDYEFFLVKDTNIDTEGTGTYSLRNPVEEVTEEEPETEEPETEEPETEEPEAEEPEAEEPEAEEPEAEEPETEEPETEEPETEEPETEEPETEEPEAEEPEAEEPEAEEPEAETPAAEETATETPVAQNTDSESDEVVATDVVETDNEA